MVQVEGNLRLEMANPGDGGPVPSHLGLAKILENFHLFPAAGRAKIL